MGFSNKLPNVIIDIFNDEQNERIDGRFVPMTDSEVDYLIATRENANLKNNRLVQEIAVLVFKRFMYNKQNITCALVDKKFHLLVFKSISHRFFALTREIST